jgi:NAD(P)-dependent dehydrogenase (short-subunit alcohol dehydrogenase family)
MSAVGWDKAGWVYYGRPVFPQGAILLAIADSANPPFGGLLVSGWRFSNLALWLLTLSIGWFRRHSRVYGILFLSELPRLKTDQATGAKRIMGIYAMTGGATGIGAELKRQLVDRGHQVISVDIVEGDIIADLSTAEGRQAAIDGVRQRAPDGLDGFIPCAGLPPVAKPLSLVAQVNYFGVVATVAGLRDLVAKKRGSILLVASNSAPMITTDDSFVQACLSGDEAAACADIEARDGHTAYAGSKRAITVWMRRNVVEYAAAGVRLNAVAPGITMTPLAEQVLADEELGQAMKEFGEMVPWGGTAQPAQIANVMRFMLSEEADFVCGSIVFVDGGSDAMMRTDDF